MRIAASAIVVASCVCAVTAMCAPPGAQGAAGPPNARKRAPSAVTRTAPAHPRRVTPAARPLTDDVFVSALRNAPTSAVAIRRLDAGSRKANLDGWMQARTWSDARGVRYEVIAAGGSGRVIDKVLKPVLDAEVEHSQAQASPQAAMTAANYTFAVERHPSRVLVRIAAKRADVRLINGVATFTPSGLLQRIEGRLADRPSFWVKAVTVVRDYAKVEGVTVPRSVESIADVRLAGLSRFLMTYQYERVNGRRVRAPEPAPSARGVTADPSPRILALHLTSP